MLLTCDDYSYTSKPDRDEFARLVSRMKRTRPREVDKRGFLEHISAGKAWQGGTFAGGTQESMLTMQVFALDFDNVDEKTHEPLRFDDPMFISPWDALARCESLEVTPLVMYQTMNYTRDNPRFRLAFMLDEPITDYELAKAVQEGLMFAFPECDPQCKNLNRPYLGTTKAVWAICEAWFI